MQCRLCQSVAGSTSSEADDGAQQNVASATFYPAVSLDAEEGGRRSGRRALSCGSFERVSLRHGLFKGIWVVQLTIWSCEKLGGTVRAIPPCKTMWFCCLRLLWHALIWSAIALPLFVATPYFSE